MALLSHTLWKSLCGVDKDSSVTYINIIHFTSEIPRQFYVQRGYTCTSVVKNSLYYKLAAIYIHIRENKFYFYPRCRAPRERWVVYAQQRAPRTEKQKKTKQHTQTSQFISPIKSGKIRSANIMQMHAELFRFARAFPHSDRDTYGCKCTN